MRRGLGGRAPPVYRDRLRAGLGVDEGVYLIAHLPIGLRRPQALAVEPREHHRDVVGPTPLVGERDQLVARGLQVPLTRRDGGHLLLLYLARQAVGARSEERRVGKSVDLGGRRIIKKKKKRRGQQTTEENKHSHTQDSRHVLSEEYL